LSGLIGAGKTEVARAIFGDLIVRRGQAVFVLGLIMLLTFAALEFLFFIGLMSQQGRRL
jgi:hypothetical protein